MSPCMSTSSTILVFRRMCSHPVNHEVSHREVNKVPFFTMGWCLMYRSIGFRYNTSSFIVFSIYFLFFVFKF